jgi:hypothetical protein
VLDELEQLRERHSDEEVNVVALYLNPTNDAALAQLKQQRGFAFPIAQAQPAIARLDEAFAIRGAGVDVYVVAPGSGKIRTVAEYGEKGGDPAKRIAKVEELIAKR